MKKIVFTGGGTLGHVMPNTYLMDELQDYEIHYIGSNGVEKSYITALMKNYHEISATKLRRGKFFANLKIPFLLIKSIHQSKKILKKISPDVIFSKGGYVALPVCIAGRMLKIPIVAHESDSSFGLANKIILKTCNVMCVNFKNLEGKNKKIRYTGPVFSKEFESNVKDKSGLNLDVNKPTILIVGGSLGSQKINDAIYAILKDVLASYNVIHITGKGNKKINSYDNYNAFEMRKDMSNLYNLSDFIIGRAGAGVTAEAFFKQLPMLLIPLENKASRGDQVLNAKYYQDLQVADILPEKDLTPTKLLSAINKINEKREKIQENYTNLKQINGRDEILKIINKIAKTN